MEIREAINRGNNLLMAGFLAVVGFGMIPEIFRETEWIDRSDDIIVTLLAIAVSSWYLYGNNRYKRSLVPFGLLIVALITKVAGLMLEFDDQGAAGDELGVIPIFILIIILSGYLLYKTRNA
jgi:hypothetical protein